MRGRAADVVGLLARLVLGAVLLLAGVLKVGDPRGSARAVQAYELLPFDVATLVGYGLPWLEIVVGVLLLLGLFTRAAAVTGGVLMAAFVFGISWAWAHGLTIDCGCFGGGGTVGANQTKYGQDLARDAGLLALAAWLVVRPRSLLSLDHSWFGPAPAPDHLPEGPTA